MDLLSRVLVFFLVFLPEVEWSEGVFFEILCLRGVDISFFMLNFLFFSSPSSFFTRLMREFFILVDHFISFSCENEKIYCLKFYKTVKSIYVSLYL